MKTPLTLCFLMFSLPVWAGMPVQSHAEIRLKVSEFVQEQTQAMPGKVSLKVDGIDPRIVLPACPGFEVFLPQGTQLSGKTNVGVRCKDSWSLFVPVQIKITLTMLIASHPLQQGQTLTATDISTQSGEVSQPGILTDPAQALGKILKYSLGSGQILKQDMLRAPWSVTQGQMVKLRVRMEGFFVTSEGKALNNAAEGQPVQVRTASGQVIGGTAGADGAVEVKP
ncbi:Flagella basal body P-ring formation protein FlgA [Ferriphaselus amnicola]|uniref:Flagella basal body P-ring formation protein FlgA n=1 Tax=Ferriphaselus amnicola TaxID=1188319 RepID=A0A2Z6GDD8_9PROT|nr:flagellar basal body P-ring formation chaperone FlgA [Ferriphaselus amnicola]BBE51349.1 Flagella basal body P-ring formation protein FlgA [Ferriphaselus amnicola]